MIRRSAILCIMFSLLLYCIDYITKKFFYAYIFQDKIETFIAYLAVIGAMLLVFEFVLQQINKHL